MRYITFLSTIVLLLSACGMSFHSTGYQREKVVPGKRYEGERFSVLPPDRNSWEVVTYKDPDDVGFHLTASKDGNTLRNLSVVISPFSGFSNAESFERRLRRENDEAKRTVKLRKSSEIFISTITRAGMRCVLVEILDTPRPPAPKSFSQDFICYQPNQPKDFPPIEISYKETMRSEYKDYANSSEVLAPIWASLQFKPVDRVTSKAYQNWLVSNAKYRENLRRLGRD